MFTRLLHKRVDISLHDLFGEVNANRLFVILLVNLARDIISKDLFQNVLRFTVYVNFGELFLSSILNNDFVRSRFNELFFHEIIIFLQFSSCFLLFFTLHGMCKVIIVGSRLDLAIRQAKWKAVCKSHGSNFLCW